MSVIAFSALKRKPSSQERSTAVLAALAIGEQARKVARRVD
jgi:hypothetical protein